MSRTGGSFRRVQSPRALTHIGQLIPADSIARAFFDGVMGWALISGEPVESAGVVVGDFVLLLGRPDPAIIEAVRAMPGDALHILPAADEWNPLLEALVRDGARPYTREVFDWATFDTTTFYRAESHLPDGSALNPIDETMARTLLTNAWSRDVVGNFVDPADFVERALGFVVECDGVVASAAGCYTCYAEGIEVEVDTHPDHRRRGFARAASLALIREAMTRGIAVHWDAMNDASASLARSLGYTSSVRYRCLEVQRSV